MKKILYNAGYGGFGFSNKLLEQFGINGGQYCTEAGIFNHDIKNRTNPAVILAVEEIGLKKSSGDCCKLAILEVNDEDIYEIVDFDGKEELIYKGSLNDSRIIF